MSRRASSLLFDAAAAESCVPGFPQSTAGCSPASTVSTRKMWDATKCLPLLLLLLDFENNPSTLDPGVILLNRRWAWGELKILWDKQGTWLTFSNNTSLAFRWMSKIYSLILFVHFSEAVGAKMPFWNWWCHKGQWWIFQPSICATC